MTPKLKAAFLNEMAQAKSLYVMGEFDQSFAHLERAHIIGQRYTIMHTKSHWWMLKVGWQRRDWREVFGQIPRIVASMLISRIWVPLGNTGGTNVSPLKPMPVPPDLAALLGIEA